MPSHEHLNYNLEGPIVELDEVLSIELDNLLDSAGHQHILGIIIRKLINLKLYLFEL